MQRRGMALGEGLGSSRHGGPAAQLTNTPVRQGRRAADSGDNQQETDVDREAVVTQSTCRVTVHTYQ